MESDASSSVASTLVVLAPSIDLVPASFGNVYVDPTRHQRLLAGLQRLRGAAYLEDGAITRDQLTPDERHVQAADDKSWHIVAAHADGTVSACARYRPHDDDVVPEEVGAWQSPLASDDRWRSTLRNALLDDMQEAASCGMSYVELGGWAVSRAKRNSAHALETVLTTYALAGALGGCIGITTATVRHCSSLILRRLGGRGLEFAGLPIPSYFDPRYGCEMELLRFDSRAPSPRYADRIASALQRISTMQVVALPGEADVLGVGVADAQPAFLEHYLPSFGESDAFVPAVA